jgi:hypothetical protein
MIWFQSYLRKDSFIATQVPLEDTIEDFWRLIYDHNAKIIIMIITEDQVPVCRPITHLVLKWKGLVIIAMHEIN